MKASRETNRKVIKVPIEGRARIESTMREQRFTGRTIRVCHKATGTTKRLPVLDCYQGQKLLSQSKIKLQLFPVNEATRIGLEKDGHHPYLELILRPRKKITAVLKHLNDKWGRSSISLDQPVLFPYKMPDSMSSNRRWTLNDGNISVGAVYAAIGSPAVFRLRYGWFSTEPKTADQPSTSANDLRSEGEQRCRSPATENVIDELWKQTALVTKDFKSNDASETINADTEKISTGAVDPRGKLNGFDAQPVEWNAGLPPTQGQRPSTHDSCLSIFDAEETCHAFPSQKFYSSGKDVLGFGGSRGCFNQNPGSKLFKFPDAAKANSVAELPQDQRGCQESDTALMICLRVNNNERSLGLSGIKW